MTEMPIPAEIERLSNTLFQRFRQKKHTVAQLADWTLNLNTLMSVPPPKLRGYTPTNYCHFDPKRDEDLKAICHDFVRCAVHSVRMIGKHTELKLTTTEAENE